MHTLLKSKFIVANFNRLVPCVAVMALILSSGADANPLYKCEVDGRTEYQDKPCATVKQQVACIQGEAQPIRYSNELTEPCQPKPSESVGYGGYSTSGSYASRAYKSSSAGTDVHVRGYTKSNGTYVSGHTRSAPGRGRGR